MPDYDSPHAISTEQGQAVDAVRARVLYAAAGISGGGYVPHSLADLIGTLCDAAYEKPAVAALSRYVGAASPEAFTMRWRRLGLGWPPAKCLLAVRLAVMGWLVANGWPSERVAAAFGWDVDVFYRLMRDTARGLGLADGRALLAVVRGADPLWLCDAVLLPLFASAPDHLWRTPQF